jgi:hypothetical protein
MNFVILKQAWKSSPISFIESIGSEMAYHLLSLIVTVLILVYGLVKCHLFVGRINYRVNLNMHRDKMAL